MDDELELSLSPVRKSAPSKGRRANNVNQGINNDEDSRQSSASPLRSRPMSGGELFQEDLPASGRPQPPKSRPPHGRRTGGWADENSRAKTAKSVRMMGAAMNEVIQDSDEDDGPAIPDLDDVRDEDMALQVAEAPSVAVNRVATYKELDSDLLKHVAFATLDDIDLKLLTKRMAPESALKEPDEAWNWDVVFAEVSGELQREWYPEEDNLATSDKERESKTIEDDTRPSKERPYTAFNRFPV